MKVSETLNKAADLIEEHGWGRGNMSFLGRDGLCLEGAIYAATHGGAVADTFRYHDLEECPSYRAVVNHLGTRATDDEGRLRLWFWNDRRAASAEEVIETLRACAVIEEAREEQDEAFATYAENIAVSA